MGIIAWILLGLVSGLLAHRLACREFPGGSAEPWPKGRSVPVTVPVRRHDTSR